MFSLFYGLYQYLSRKEEIRILILGIDQAGKTTLLERLKGTYTGFPGLEPDKVLPTVGLNVGRLRAFGADFMLWDLGGQSGLRSIWDKYYSDSHAVLFVVDSSTPERLDEAKAAMEKALGSRELYGAPLLVAANKQDILGAVSALEVQEHLGLGKIGTRPTKVQPISALSGTHIAEAVQWLLTEIHRSDRFAQLRQLTR